jgi:hypothetical protein
LLTALSYIYAYGLSIITCITQTSFRARLDFCRM